MKRLVIGLISVLALSTVAKAEAEDISFKKTLGTFTAMMQACKEKLQSDKEKLECYNMVAESAASISETINSEPKAAEKPNSETTDYKVVDAADVYVATSKYMNRPIELRNAKCFYADVNEYRCLGEGSLTLLVISAEITPPTEKKAIQEDCDSIKNISSRKCMRTLRFTPVASHEDTLSGYQRRKTIVTRSMEVLPPEASAGRRRR